MSGKNQIIGGAFQDFEGNPLAFGYITMRLSHDEQQGVNPGQVVGGYGMQIPLDANGNIAGTVSVWPNDQLNPNNSYYVVNAFRADGTLAWAAPQFQTVTTSPSPFNVGVWVPNNPAPSPASSAGQSILLQVNGVNSLDQNKLNAVAGTNMTITDDGTGDWTFAAAGGITFNSAPAFLSNQVGSPYGFLPTTDGFFNCTSANKVQVFMFRLDFTYQFNTVTVGFHQGEPSAVVGIGLYSTAGNRLIHWDNVNAAASNAIMTQTATGGAQSLSPGYYYWAWACSVTTQVTSGQGLSNGGSSEASEPWNHSVVRGGGATNSMSAGVLPSTLGTLGAGFANSNQSVPHWIVEP